MIRKVISILIDLYQLNSEYFRKNFLLVKNRKSYNYIEDYNSFLNSFEPVFFLSTGRCGTLFITDFLNNSHLNISVFHDKRPEFIYSAQKLFEANGDGRYGNMAIESAKMEDYIEQYIIGNKFIETNNLITFNAYELSRLFPKSKFIHLVRHPGTFVRSGVSRDWYSGNSPHDPGKIHPPAGSMDKWVSFDLIKKIGWLWNSTNLFIERFKTSLSGNRCLTVKAENLFTDPKQLQIIEEFIGLPKTSSIKIERTTKKKTNKQQKHKLPSYSHWNNIQKESLREIIDPELLKKFGYEL